MSESITAYCPECLSRYRLKPDMIGRRMRCTNSECQSAFEVVPEEDRGLIGAHRLPAEANWWDGPAYALKGHDDLPALQPEQEFDWQAAPPPIQIVVDEQAPAPEYAKSWEDVVDYRDHRQVVIPKGRLVSSPPKPLPSVPVAAPLFLPPPPKGHGRKIFLAFLSLIVIGGITTGAVAVVHFFGQAEDRLSAEANQFYEAGDYRRAADAYRALAEQYPNGLHAAEYRFLAAFADVRYRVGLVPPEPDKALEVLSAFLDEHGASPFLKGRRNDVFAAALKILNDLLDDGAERLKARSPDMTAVDAQITLAKKALLLLSRYVPSSTDAAGPRTKLDQLIAAVTLARAKAAARAEILALLAKPRPDLDTARDLIHRAGFESDPEIAAAWQRAEEALRKLVAYRSMDKPASREGPKSPPAIYPDSKPIAGAGPRVPALALGVLWALEAGTGRIAWVARLGMDATIPPLRITAVDGQPEAWLVLAAEPPSISLRDATNGSIRWYQPLDAMPVGPPVIVGRRGFLALGGPQGRVLDFDALTGTITGAFETGQPLAGGLVHRPGTSLLYVPAMAQQVYVLDFAPEEGPPRCATTLATGHAPGSLRSPPVIVSATNVPSLLLTLADGLGETALSLFRLDGPVGATASALTARLPGWIWFPPDHDAERITAVTDRGALGLFAFGRPGATDPPLYPLDERESTGIDGSPRRSLVVDADEGGLVVLANGRLSQWRLGIHRTEGRRLVPGWQLSEPLGSPLHPAYPVGPGMVALTTLRDDPVATLVTAVNVSTGAIVWQRTLGIAPSDQTHKLGKEFFTIDARGGLTKFASNTEGQAADGASVRLSGRELAASIPGASGRPYIVNGLIFVPQGQVVVIRRIVENASIEDKKITLPAALAGAPAVSADAAVLPLANGTLVRISLDPADASMSQGPSWRSPGVTPETLCQIVHLHEHSYLVNDGGRRFMKLNWPTGPEFELDSAKALELPARPIRIARDANGGFAAIADTNGIVSLVDTQRWTITAKVGRTGHPITAGPELSNNELTFTIDNREIECYSYPAIDRGWKFAFDGDGFVGMPERLPNSSLMMIADRSGQLIAFNPELHHLAVSPRPVPHVAYRLSEGSPSGRPITFDGEWIFVPLADGTAALVPIKSLPEPPR